MDSGTAQSKCPLKGTASPMAREFEGLRAQHRDFLIIGTGFWGIW